ncbi:hypothetical protein BH10PLA2_BH10PLA2_08080 [soil metagenome]
MVFAEDGISFSTAARQGEIALNRQFAIPTYFFSLAVFLAASSIAHCQENKPAEPGIPAKSVRLDRDGVLLPPGAIARLGSTRLRHGGVTDFIFLADSQTLLTAGTDGVLRYWDVNTGVQKRIKLLGLQPGLVKHVTLSRNGKVALVERVLRSNKNGSNEVIGQCTFYDAEFGQVLKSYETPADWLLYRELSPDGIYLYGMKWEKGGGPIVAKSFVKNWMTGVEHDVSIPSEIQNMAVILGAGFSPNGKWCAVGGNRFHHTKVIELSTGKTVCTLGKRKIESLDFTPDSSTLIVTCTDERQGKNLRRYVKIPSGELERETVNQDGWDECSVANDGKHAAVVRGNEICLVDFPTGKVQRSYLDFGTKLQFSPDDRMLALTNRGELHLWNLQSEKKLEPTPSITATLALSTDGKRAASFAPEQQSLCIWDIEKQQIESRCQSANSKVDLQSFSQLVFTADGQTLYAKCDSKSEISAWDVSSGKAKKSIYLKQPLQGLDPNLNLSSIAPDARYALGLQSPVAKGNRANLKQLSVWNLPDGKLVYSHSVSADWFVPSWLPRSRAMISNLKNEFGLFDLVSGKILTRITPSSHTRGFVPNSDGRLLATKQGLWVNSTSLDILESVTGKVVVELPVGVPDNMVDPVWLDDRSLLVVRESEIQAWDICTQTIRYRIPLVFESTSGKDKLAVSSMRLLPGGRRLFTSNLDGTGLLWELGPAFSIRPKETKFVSGADAHKLWKDLESSDAAVAYRAIWRFIDSPSAIPSLIAYLKQPKYSESENPQELIALLDDKNFNVREKAQKQLEALGTSALQAIRNAREQKNSPEVKRRLGRLMERILSTEILAGTLRRLRAIQVLEKVNSADTRNCLTHLAASSASALEKEEVQAALERIKAANEAERSTATPKK